MAIGDGARQIFRRAGRARVLALVENREGLPHLGGIRMLRIEITKREDGSGLLRCFRQDGSVTWQKQDRHAAHFALHDLTHFAVETVLRYRRGFFGLIAEGWDLEETTGKGKRGPLPAEAAEVEKIVGLFDSERACGQLWTVNEFNTFAPRALSQAEIQNIRTARGDLFGQWSAVQLGKKLELQFDLD